MAFDYSKGIDRSAPFNRTSAFPLDQQCYFESITSARSSAESARDAGDTTTTYYYGQTVTVVENDIVTNYKIVKNSNWYSFVYTPTEGDTQTFKVTDIVLNDNNTVTITVNYGTTYTSTDEGLKIGDVVISTNTSYSSTDPTTWTLGTGVVATKQTGGKLVSLEQAGEVGQKVLEEAKAYTDTSINNLDVSEIKSDNKFIRAVSETNGKISATTDSITNDDLPSIYVTKLQLGPNQEKISTDLLPSYVDDVIELKTFAASAPSDPTVGEKYYNTTDKKIYTCTSAGSWGTGATPEKDKIYVAVDTNITYRWGGTDMVMIATALALGETEKTAYRGDRGKEAYDHATDSSKATSISKGLYKISVTDKGHVGSDIETVVESDITSLIATTLATKADKVTTISPEGHVASLDENGNLVDSQIVALDIILSGDDRLKHASELDAESSIGLISKGELNKVTATDPTVDGSIVQAYYAALSVSEREDNLESNVGNVPSSFSGTVVSYAEQVAESAEYNATQVANKKMQYLGVTTTDITSTQHIKDATITVNSAEITASDGDIVTFTVGSTAEEFIWKGSSTGWVRVTDHANITSLNNSKANKVTGATNGDIAKLDGNGDLVDTGVSSDVLQGAGSRESDNDLGLISKAQLAKVTGAAATDGTIAHAEATGAAAQAAIDAHDDVIATTSQLGHVKSSTTNNDVSVNSSTGVMTVNNITTDKLVNGSNTFIIDGGDAEVSAT